MKIVLPSYHQETSETPKKERGVKKMVRGAVENVRVLKVDSIFRLIFVAFFNTVDCLTSFVGR